jgi:uncharacterized protein YkwD
MQIKPNNSLIKVAYFGLILSVIIFVSLLYQMAGVVQARQISYREEDLLALINSRRQNLGIEPLQLNEQLSKAASAKTQDMIKNNYFSHISPVDNTKWSDFIDESNYVYAEAGENLANGFDNANEMVESWMNSQSHRENIVNTSFSETGFGLGYGKLDDVPTIFVVQVFGRQ